MKTVEKSTVALIAIVFGLLLFPAVIASSEAELAWKSLALVENISISNIYEYSTKISENTQSETKIAYVIIPNGNALLGITGFFIPTNLEIKTGTTVIWQNDDNHVHTVQSRDKDGIPTGTFSSNVLKTGDTFEHKFNEAGEYNYYCTLHPWRTGIITVGE